MRPESSDAAYLWDILDAAHSIQEFCVAMNLESYVVDKKLQAAVERKLEIIGEAARRLSEAFKAKHPEIPWSKIIAQRNVLAHEYGDIRQDRIWAVASIHIPELINHIEKLLPPSGS